MVIKMQDVLGSIGARKALPFTKFLNYGLNKVKGSGVLQNIFAIPKQNCPLDENPIPITFFKMVFLFVVFIFGVILSSIIFIFERAVSNGKDGRLEKDDVKQCKMCRQRIPDTSEIGDHYNIGQSVTIGTRNIIIH